MSLGEAGGLFYVLGVANKGAEWQNINPRFWRSKDFHWTDSWQPRLTTKYFLRVRLSVSVTLMVDNFFTLTRQDYATPTQLQHDILRASCVRSLRRGCIEVISVTSLAPPPPNPPVSLVEDGIARTTLFETIEMRDFATSLGRSIRQHSVRDKSKEDTSHLPYNLANVSLWSLRVH